MLTKATARAVPGFLFSLSIALTHAQSRATCLYSESFAEGSLPADWVGLPTQVEQLDGDGAGTGEFTAPWQVGNATQANAGGYFPVPDEPEGNTFALANDDAPPCDCGMDDLSLFSPFYDLSGTTAPALSYRVYHDGRPFNTHAWLQVSPDGSAWTTIDLIPAVLGAWQQRTVDLSAFASGSVQFRFRYNDGGNWASGLAVDDICVFARVPNDIALTSAWLGDASESAFNTSTRSLAYSRMPIEQQSPLRLSARIRNNGTATATEVRIQATISVDGTEQSVTTHTVVGSLDPLRDTLVAWEPGFVSAEPGIVTIDLVVEAFNPDEETSDNTRSLGYLVTTADEGNNTMALDNDLATALCGSDSGFSAGCRYEMIGTGSMVHGISVRFGGGTQPGGRVHALLMTESLNLLRISSGHTITEEDLALSFSGGAVYFPFDTAYSVTEAQDVVALIRCLPDSGVMRVACGGPVLQGAAFVIDAGSFLIDYPGTAPIVRLHLTDPVTGLSGYQAGVPNTITVSPNPARDRASVRLPSSMAGPSRCEVFTDQGRSMHSEALPNGASTLVLDTSAWPPGLYLVRVTAAGIASSTALIVE